MSEMDEALFVDLDNYFEHVSDNKNANVSLAEPFIKRWQSAFINGGFDWIVWKLEKEGFEQSQGSVVLMSNQMADLLIYKIPKIYMKALSDALSIYGNDAGKQLSVMDINPCEDSRSLIYYMFANEYLDTLTPMEQDIKKMHLRILHRENYCVGTSAKMTLTWLLYCLGEKKYWEELINSDQLWNKKFRELIRSVVADTYPEMEEQKVISLVYRILAVPESTEFSILNKQGIMNILAMDIATKGAAFQENNPGWKRKTNAYNFLVISKK